MEIQFTVISKFLSKCQSYRKFKSLREKLLQQQASIMRRSEVIRKINHPTASWPIWRLEQQVTAAYLMKECCSSGKDVQKTICVHLIVFLEIVS